MDNAEAVARQTDVDSGSDNKDTESKALDAQTILDGAYSELVKGGKVEAGNSIFPITQHRPWHKIGI